MLPENSSCPSKKIQQSRVVYGASLQVAWALRQRLDSRTWTFKGIHRRAHLRTLSGVEYMPDHL